MYKSLLYPSTSRLRSAAHGRAAVFKSDRAQAEVNMNVITRRESSKRLGWIFDRFYADRELSGVTFGECAE